MKDNKHQSPNQKHNKDKHFKNQFLAVYECLMYTSATRKELSVLLDIDRANICRYIKTLRDSNRVWVVCRRQCTITGHRAEELTCNPDLKPDDNQLKLFS
jgi:DNA-binding transcriptional regulator LsrR (DeoR family)